jgi:hypothetical protein
MAGLFCANALLLRVLQPRFDPTFSEATRQRACGAAALPSSWATPVRNAQDVILEEFERNLLR